MKTGFEQQLNEELLRSEKKRIIILIIIFMAAVCFRAVDALLFKVGDEAVVRSFSTVWLFPFIIILFELFTLLYINKRIKENRRFIPPIRQFFNTALEICLPTGIILYVARQHPAYNILQSPAVMIYFIFIILSTLRLNFGLSLFCGILSCLAYVSFCLILYDRFYTSDAARALILLFSGVAAGMVARQIRAGISKSAEETERRHRVENLFGQQISMEVAEKMLESNGNIESRRMKVAIMFIDIRNFSRFAADKNPEEIVQYQNAFFRIVINTVMKYNGIVHQFLGDGCMITFGAPLELENPSRNAVLASVMLLKALESAAEKGELAETRIGIGIHTGEVVTGNIGTAERQQYSITGSVVILASRIEQLNKQFDSQLLVSEEVIREIDETEATSFGYVALKGWQNPISIYKLA